MGAPEILLPVRDYDLAATLDSGQVFRWQQIENSWQGVIGRHSVRLTPTPDGIHAATIAPVESWDGLREYLQTEIDFDAVLKIFPAEGPMRNAVAHCPGLRLLRQDPWECLASFILSSTKQIVQIRQIVALLCARFGTGWRRRPVANRAGSPLPAAAGNERRAWSAAPYQPDCFSHSTANRRRFRVGTARLQDGIPRAEPARRRAKNCRRQF